MRLCTILLLSAILAAAAHAFAQEESRPQGKSPGGQQSTTSTTGNRSDSNASSALTAQDEGFLQTSGVDKGFSNDSELGFVQSQGNSNAQTTNLRQTDSYNWTGNTFTGKYDFLRSESRGDESARRWDASLMYERDLTQDFGAFLYQGDESDEYAGYNLRTNSEVGMRYNIAKQKTWEWLTYLGYRYTAEQRLQPPHYYSDFGHIYTEANAQLNRAVWTQVWADYLPNFSHRKDFQINAEASLNVMMTRILSLKSSYQVRYDNVPAPGATHQRDTLLTTSLVARF